MENKEDIKNSMTEKAKTLILSLQNLMCENLLDTSSDEEISENRIITRVTSRGKKIRLLKCPPGKIVKVINGRKTCVAQTGRAKLIKKLAVKQANRTKKSKGAGYKRKINFKRAKARRFRKQMGL